MGTRSNRRTFTRVPIAFRVKILTEEATFASSTALNLSLGGLLVQIPRSLALGTPCHVVLFMLEDGLEQKILAEGIVVREAPGVVAIRFTRLMGEESKARLERLVLHRSPDPQREQQAFEAYVRQGR